MSSFRIYDHDRDEELLPERDNREIKGFGYSTPEDALEAYTRVYEDLDAFYRQEQIFYSRVGKDRLDRYAKTPIEKRNDREGRNRSFPAA